MSRRSVGFVVFGVGILLGGSGLAGCGKQADGRHRRGRRRRVYRRKGAAWRRRPRPRVEVRPGDRARVPFVIDGDTVYLSLVGRSIPPFKARLAGVNAPECHKRRARLPTGRWAGRCVADDEYFGLAAYVLLKNKVEGKEVRIDCPTDRTGRCRHGSYGRPLVFLELREDGRFLDVNKWLVERGAAWPFTKYPSPRLAAYCLAEERAWKVRAGMWRAGTRWAVMARMSKKTRRWYARRDSVCRKLVRKRKHGQR